MKSVASSHACIPRPISFSLLSQCHCLVVNLRATAMKNSQPPNSSSRRSRIALTLMLYSRNCMGSAHAKKVKRTFTCSSLEKEETCEETQFQQQQSKQIQAGNDPLKLPTEFPERYKLVSAASLAFVVCNMDKVNMSVSIIPMSQQLGWSATTAGLVQSSFFWGYALSQLPGGWLSKNISGMKVLRAGVFIWSIATAIVPIVTSSLPALFLCRLLVGIGEGLSPSAVTDLIARNVAMTERARAVAFAFGGLNVGTILGLFLAPVCIEAYGWESVFYIFSAIGLLWCVGFDIVSKRPMPSSNSVDKNSTCGDVDDAGVQKNAEFLRDVKLVPWKAFFTCPSVWAMIYAHFCGNWGHYTLLAWLPTYFSDELHLDVTNAALVSMLPSVASIVVSFTAAYSADTLISQGVNTTLVRKICQSVAFLGPSIFMGLVSLDLHLHSSEIILCLTIGMGLSSFSLAGLYCTHQDISPQYASILLGITNTFGAVPGILGVAFTGYIYEQTNSWNLAIFAPSIFFYLTGALVWNIFASSNPQNFEP